MSETATEKGIDKLAEGVEALSRAVQKIAPQAWETMVRQAVLENALLLAVWFAEVIGVLLIARFLRKYLKAEKEYQDTWEPVAVACVIVGAIGVGIIVIQAAAGGPETIAALFNPEYAAARDFVEALK